MGEEKVAGVVKNLSKEVRVKIPEVGIPKIRECMRQINEIRGKMLAYIEGIGSVMNITNEKSPWFDDKTMEIVYLEKVEKESDK